MFVYAFCIWVLHDNDIPSVKMARPELSVTTASGRLLVEWKILSPVSDYLYHCQVKYSTVCQPVCLSVLCLSNTWSDNVDKREGTVGRKCL